MKLRHVLKGLREQAGGALKGLVDEVLLGPGWFDDVV